MPFSNLGLGPNILKAIHDAGYKEPTPIQAKSIPLILAGNDLIGIAQTGTGKTAAFVLPILTNLVATTGGGNKPGCRALILAPTRELAAQIEENVQIYAKYLSLRHATIFGGVGERPQIAALKAGVELIIATPGRLLDLMKQGYGNFAGVSHLVLDEADRMLDMGFLPDIRRIIRTLPPKRQTLLFSATLSKEIETLTHEFQHSPKIVEIGRRSNPAETVTQFIHEVPKHLKPALLLHLLADPALDTVLVFSRTKHGADRIARNLERAGIKTAALHSNRSQNQRLRALKDFKSGVVRVLVATDIAARGIDVEGISHVINFDFPMHSEDYVHRIGRTGRAQQVGVATSFVTDEDRAALRSLERFIGRGIVRKKAEGFNYGAAAPKQVEGDGERPRRGGSPRQSQSRGGRSGESSNSQPRSRSGGGKSREEKASGSSRSGPSRGPGKAKSVPSLRGIPGGMTWSPGRR
ncbi:MAG: DEAD/DEAH box helicase [Chthoniobacteraceae bacterium]